MEIDKKITKLRKDRNMTQKELADFLNVTDKAVSRWESGVGNPEIELIPKIAKIFNVSTDYLLTDSNDKGNNKKIVSCKNNISLKATLLSIAVGIFLIAFIVFLSVFISAIVQYNAELAKATDRSPVGLSFALSELTDKTIEFAATQGVTITKESEAFVQWQTALLGKYTQHNNSFIYNLAPVLNNVVYVFLILAIVSVGSLVPLIIFQIKNIIKLKKDKKTKIKQPNYVG